MLKKNEDAENEEEKEVGAYLPRILLHIEHAYAVISKPADVRMDGDYSVTVEKLLQSWLPNYTKFYPVHQLDYPTSGVLCSALSREAARAATTAFEARTTKKVYVALLVGHLDLTHFEGYGNVESNTVTLDEITANLRKNEKVTHKDQINHTFIHPDNEDIRAGNKSSWQDRALIAQLDANLISLNNLDEILISNEEDIKMEYEQLCGISYDNYIRNKVARKRLRKFLKECGVDPAISMSFQEEKPPIGTENYRIKMKSYDELENLANSTTRYYDIQGKIDYEANTKIVYVQGGIQNMNCTNKSLTPLLKVQAPIAPTEGFSMRIGGKSSGGRYAESLVECVSYGRYGGVDVTKVMLYPLTGRRHQLRLHCVHIGHPILGDVTYAGHGSCKYKRMFLHNLRLSIDLDAKLRSKIIHDGCSVTCPDTMHIEDTDPFQYDTDT
jgi:23S rRNA-/tRNA-specific pseudouridylate synthase